MGLHLKKGDTVKVIAGNRDDRGKVGEIREVFPEQGKVIVDGVNVRTRHKKDAQGANGRKIDGGIIRSEGPIDASNVQLVVKVDGKEVVTRIGYKRVEVTKTRSDGSEYPAMRSVRIAKKTGEEI